MRIQNPGRVLPVVPDFEELAMRISAIARVDDQFDLFFRCPQMRRADEGTQYLLDRTHSDFAASGLHNDSVVNCCNLYTIRGSTGVRLEWHVLYRIWF